VDIGHALANDKTVLFFLFRRTINELARCGQTCRSVFALERLLHAVRDRVAHRLSRLLIICCGCEQDHVIGSKPALQAGSNRLKDSDDGREIEPDTFLLGKA
jgi:hypothetical protein